MVADADLGGIRAEEDPQQRPEMARPHGDDLAVLQGID